MATQAWSPGTLYIPGSIVRPRGAQAVDVGQPDNPGFETGNITDWSFSTVGGSGTPVASIAQKYSGTYSVFWSGGVGSGSEGGIECILINDDRAAVNPGQSITGLCFIMYNPAGHQAGSRGACRLNWYDASNNFISYSEGGHVAGRGNNGRWVQATVTAVAPPNAAFASIGAWLTARNGDIYADAFSWNYAYAGVPVGLVFRAVQADAGFSGNAEPAWPSVNGQTVVDNEVTWEAVLTSRVTWEASPILKSGGSEPIWPTLEGGSIVDGSISWVATTGRIEDENNPQTKVVAIAASKIFAGDRDIIPFSATTNALDWTSTEDAGYLPFGLQTYGSTPVEALGLYRSNLVAFNAEGFQMWQVDQDPANMALLDAVAVSCPYPKTPQPVGNDLVFLSPKGFRNMNIAGASTNLQAGTFGESIDPLVTPKIKAGTYEPFSLFWPAFGQFWGIFGDEAFVLTVNGPKDLSWSRYTFSEVITDWTLHGSELYLRTEDNKVWRVSDDALQDDIYTIGDPPVLSGVSFLGNNDLSWTEYDPEDTAVGVSYLLERSINGGAYTVIDTVPIADPREYTDPVDEPGTYSYRVRVINEVGDHTGYSNVVALNSSDFGNNVLLLQYNTGVQVESTGVPHVDQVIGEPPQSGITTVGPKFGTASYRNQNQFVDHTNYVDAYDDVNLNRFAFSGPFTMEGWFYCFTDGGGALSTIFANSKTPSAGYFFLGFQWDSGVEARALQFNYNAAGVEKLLDLLMPFNQWVHVAITRDDDDVVRVFLDGVPSATQPVIPGTFGGLASDDFVHFTICEGVPFVSADMDAKFDQIRVKRNVCLYTEAFTPPDAPFPTE